MMRPKLLISDLKLRLFLDTNVLIDYEENSDEQKAVSFINQLKNSNFENIELLTSDWILWELYHYFKRDHYIRKMICDKRWGFKRAFTGVAEFKKATQQDMNEFGVNIKNQIDKLEEILHIERLMSKDTEGFSETIENFMKCSKFSYNDTIILVSSLFTHSNILVTIDRQFRSEISRISELEEELESLPQDFLRDSGLINLKFEPPIEFTTQSKIKRKYKQWFKEYNKDKIIGKITDYWKESNVCGVVCFKNYTIKENDYIFLIKFSQKNDLIKNSFRVERNCLRDYETKETIREGKKVTIKLPEDFTFDDANLVNAMVFISE